jgi:Fe2+ transport system protein FeoA
VTDSLLIPLSFMPPGQTGTLEEIRGRRHHFTEREAPEHAGPVKQYRRAHKDHHDRGHRLLHRLPHMGFVPGARVRVIKNSSTGPVIVAVGETRIGLARGVAMKILIRPTDSSGPARQDED